MSKMTAKASRLARVAVLVDQLALTVEADRLPKAQRETVRAQVRELIGLLAPRTDSGSEALAAALGRLADQLDHVPEVPRVRRKDAAHGRRFARALRRIGVIIAATATIAAPHLAAAAVGDSVLNPLTNANETVVEQISPYLVRTSAGNFIMLVTTVGQTFTDTTTTPGSPVTYEVTAVTKDSDNQVVSMTVKPVGGSTTSTVQVVTDRASAINGVGSGPGGGAGTGTGSFTFPTATGDNNNFADARYGNNGGDGSDGGGVRICVPLLGCATLGYNPTSGGAGQNGPTVNDVVDGSWGDIQTVSANLPGIVASSVGGNGGQGGDGFGINIPGAPGGAAGKGGDVTLSSSVTVTTSGDGSHGILVQSRSGSGGAGGSGYIASGGGGGGSAGQGGTVKVTNTGEISTSGKGAVGILAQSLGGAAGGGGDSYGIVGDSGGGSIGGNGGSVTVDHQGVIQTGGEDSHGILAQSVGGSGGNAGAAGGIVAFGATGAAGGNGGSVVVTSSGSVTTQGANARGVFAQSVGGGGGSAAGAGGVVALGGKGAGGGDGSTVAVTIQPTGTIKTTGAGADGILAQSIGGGGGAGSGAGGLVALGGSGAGGGAGGQVTVINKGVIETGGAVARGVFAQSVGGGGGAGGSSGGLVTIGGSGGTASTGGKVTVANEGAITTKGVLSSAIQAQSIGGGGGDGGSTGGVFLTIGGAGGKGGGSDLVTINNSGDLFTTGNDSHGIFAQSVGGGGGNGGSTVSISAFAGVAIGGKAGDGGKGGDVDVNLTPRSVTVGGATQMVDPLISTKGDRARGIFVQSVGGGGGNGGFAAQVSAGYGIGASAAVGGKGGKGGEGGLVTLDGDVTVFTGGDYAEGIFAQSVGGGGGNGGFAVSFAFAAGETAAASFAVGLGGAGGDGGAGGIVDIDSGGAIYTKGDFSTGLLTQSVGGGGGNGGFSIAFAGSAAGVASASAGVGVGGSGGKGGIGGKVDTIFDGSIKTEGDDARGAVIQSVGGGGGNGGFNVAGAASISGTVGFGAAAGVGGYGGDGGKGGDVTGSVGGAVETGGDRSTGVTVQSIGGGGGSGGFNVAGSIGGGGTFGGAVSVGVGGAGGGGGEGGEVTGSAGKTILTHGDQSGGLLVQSVGGGGGSGGFNVSGGIGGGGTVGGALSVGVGGSGGGGGKGGKVKGDAFGAVQTEGDQSAGVTVQSIGGGGGSGAFNVAGSIGGGGTVGAGMSVGVGGAGGTGGEGGQVDASSVAIYTKGDQSGGFLAQSVGGGGGNGGFNVSGSIGGASSVGVGLSVGVGGSGGGGGKGGPVTATVTGDVTTLGKDSDGVVAQSVGGGGGNGGFNVAGSISGAGTGAISAAVGVGGSGGTGGDGGEVKLNVTGKTQTAGHGSDAILAQSVGGGGGNGGFSVAGNIAVAGNGAGTVGVAVGGTGGGGGDSLGVTLKVNEGVADPADTLLAALTLGDGARAIVAQSVGGGGGNGGFTVVGGIAGAKDGAGNIGVGVGGGGGDGGNAGDVLGKITGDVKTAGKDASAVLVQSVGGGGGNGGFNVTGGIAASKSVSGNILVGVGGFGGGGGDAGEVKGGVTGDVVTEGDRSFGVSYQSLGGGGGNGGFNITGGVSLTVASGGGSGVLGVGVGGFGGLGGDGKAVTASIIGDIDTKGVQAHGALLQSVGGGGGTGGFNITGSVSAGMGVNGTLGFGLGGFGGGGGDAGKVTGTLVGDVTTRGNDSFGAMLQSVGGAGGGGGMNVTGSLSLTTGSSAAVAIGLGIGGFGGGGGDAEEVLGSVTGRYITTGDNADAVIVQSLGGGGGNGGLNVSGAVALGTGTAGTGTIGIGGFGGGGGDSKKATLTRVGDTQTDGANSDGIIVQSLAGGGGNGGINISGGLAASTSGATGALGIGIGGFGGGGGDAGDVLASITGNVHARGLASDVTTPEQVIDLLIPFGIDAKFIIPAYRTRKDGSHGVVAQSIGGGGGNGGINVTGQVALNSPGGQAARAASIGIGGFGGAGGDAGKVDLTIKSPNADRVQVSAVGDDRSAVIAQSIGGGGGAGGINVSGAIALDGTLSVGIGGFGGGGGLAKDVTANVDADLFVGGNRSRGLMAQSIGGGGGAGAINVSGGITGDKQTKEPSLVFGLGGFGGAGNISGDVTVKQNGQIMVEGVDSIGILAQSVAGGGGSGGLNVSGSITAGSGSKTEGYALAVGVGGSGGTGADAGNVVLNSVGNIFINAKPVVSPAPGADTWQAVEFTGGSTGILAQSIGGGGGVGGINATGVLAPFGNPAAIGVGGSGGSGGDGGTVTVTRGYAAASGGGETAAPGVIRTFGKDSDGLVAQSIGGGGGKAGMNFTFAATLKADDPNAALISVGGSGAGAGSGDTVKVRHNGDIVTKGDSSDGLFAQSVGGGGGDANFNIGFGILRKANALNLAVGGATGAGGTGGDVDVDHTGTIITTGRASIGIRAQSIGGGGGNTSVDMAMGIMANNALSLTIGRQGGTGGAAGDVTVKSKGAIDTTGDESSGVMAQSIGGGGGASSAITVGASGTSGTGANAQSYSGSVSVGLAGGVGATGGNVDVDIQGGITTRGADARGVFAQSIGGGGGAGGAAANAIVRAAGAAAVSVGGTGGTGATSGEVKVTNAAVIATLGARSDGVLAQSIGGGGGLGGHARTLALQIGGTPSGTTSSTTAINVGGSGGTGAIGNLVDVTNNGTIATKGAQSFGIRAQSIGGGGGIGGAAINARLQGTRSSESVDINVGGSGGTGGAGGTVKVLNKGLIFTEGSDAAGISANSIGGGGGDAGMVLDMVVGVAGSANQSHRFVANFGGSGGTGGIGGAVTVTNQPATAAHTGEIVTKGKGAYGIFAQSLGGGGGNGSSVISITGLVTGKESISAGLNIGGKGGGGERGGTVTVVNGGLIDTTGEGAHGILAQSIGGGGGNGGMVIAANAAYGATANTPLVSVGGFGGNGGDGGAVTVTNTGTIVTRGKNAHGIVAQSIGGGGGNANMGFSLTGEAKSLIISNALAGVLGALGGGTGGTGGTVTVNHTGDITVLGEGSQAIKAESINGGGGSLSLDFSGIIGLPGVPFIGGGGQPVRPDPMVVARAGADGASGMNAGKVTVTSSGTLGVAGNNGVGSFNQAVGGGGGTVSIKAVLATELDDPTNPDAPQAVKFQLALGGKNGVNNKGGDIESVHTGAIVTNGINTPGALIQSIGGGGGRGVVDITVPSGALLGPIDIALGGQNGSGETGGDITRTHTGVIATTGDLAPGAILQSIGGGGGSASVNVHAGPSAAAAARATALAGGGGTVVATLGANGGANLDGGDVSGAYSGGFSTTGVSSIGLLVQSIGAGGGETRVTGVGTLDVTLGGTGGASGKGGAITLTNTGNVVTTGARAHGVFLQSIGGGGGAVFGDASAINVALRTGNQGDGGAIRFTQTGDISVSGANAYGLVAQSIGGGGGWVDGAFAGSAGGDGRGGTIDLSVAGRILASSAGGVGVLAQSLGASGGGNMTLTSNGAIRGGSGTGVGVKFDGGASNLITTSGSISAVSGWAITGTTGDDRVNNDGLVVGNLDLGLGVNAFSNRANGTFVAFNTIDLRDSAVANANFTNAGSFLMGLSAPLTPIDLAAGAVFANQDSQGTPATNLLYGARVINTVALDGNYIQTSTGYLAFDVAFGPYASDRVNVTGDATVAGKGDVTLTWLENAKPVTLFATGGDGVNNGLNITDTLALDFSVKGDAEGIHLSFVSDFGQPFLNGNGRALGGHMDSAITAGGSGGIGRLMGLIGNLRAGDEKIYSAIFAELNPEPFLAPLNVQFNAANSFSRQMFSCATPGEPLKERCMWTRLETSSADRDGDAEYYRMEGKGTHLAGGFEQPLEGPWSLAAAVGYDVVDKIAVDTLRAQASGDGFHAGLGVKRASDDGVDLALSLSGGWQWVDMTRGVNVFEPLLGRSDLKTGYLQANLRLAKTFSNGKVFARPALNVAATALRQAAFAETGLGGLGIRGDKDTQTFGTINPELGLGVVVQDTPTNKATFTVTIGGVFHSEDRLEMPYRLVGASSSADPAIIGAPIDKSAVRVGLDFRVTGGDRFGAKFGYSAEFGDKTESHGARLDLKWRF